MRNVLTAAVLALVIALALGAARSANATFGGTNGKIAFVRGGDIWTMNADGTGQKALTTGGSAGAPSWRPDGRQIAYVRQSTIDDFGFLVDPGGIEVVNADGTGQQRILADPSVMGNGISWSPDCSRLAFGHQDGGLDPAEHIWVLNIASAAATQLTTGGALDRSPDWSPDGSKIAFTSTRQAGGGASGSTNHLLYVMKADGTAVTRLTTLPDPSGSLHERNPSWKPDGTAIVLRSDTDFGESGSRGPVVVVSADGATRTGFDTVDGPLYGANPAWSPDGTKFVMGTPVPGSVTRVAGINVYDVATQTSTALTTDGGEPSWVAGNGSCGGASDTVAPTLALPATVAVDATSPGGASVGFAVSAADNADPAPTVTCVPAALSVFAVGDTTVSCTAKDAAGNTATGTFTVHVRAPAEQFTRLGAKVLADPGIVPRVRFVLAAEIQATVNLLQRGVLTGRLSCLAPNVLLAELRALPPFAISASSRASTIADVLRIRTALGC